MGSGNDRTCLTTTRHAFILTYVALSISQSQQRLLVKTFLDKIGEKKSSLTTVKLSHVEKSLYMLAAKFKLMAENNLSVEDAVNTGKLADSIQWDEVEFMGGKYSVNISVLAYYKFIDKGVRGTQSGSSTGGFAFKNNYPSKKMMEAIRKWLIREGLKARTREVKRNPLGQEKKGVRFRRPNDRSLAYAVATNIKKKGIRPTGFWTKAGKGLEKEMENQAKGAFEIMIINEIIS